MATQRICSIPICDKLARGSQSLCDGHHRRRLAQGEGFDQSPIGKRRTFAVRPVLVLEQIIANGAVTGGDCILWSFATTKRGYPVVQYQGRTLLAHRVVCERVWGEAPTAKHEVAHSCGRGHEGCVAPHHLRWATPSENHADKVRHDTHRRGARNNFTKLSEELVLHIWKTYRAGGVTQKALADAHGIHRVTVTDIVSGRNWGWLTGSAGGT